MAALTAEQKHPVNIEVDLKKSELRIAWADGNQTVYPLVYLRKICPCAVCNEQRRNQDPLRVLKPDQANATGELTPDRPVELVGNYALQFFWKDGHQTGIYTFDFLRRMAPE
jgi:DUF971 family protein